MQGNLARQRDGKDVVDEGRLLGDSVEAKRHGTNMGKMDPSFSDRIGCKTTPKKLLQAAMAGSWFPGEDDDARAR